MTLRSRRPALGSMTGGAAIALSLFFILAPCSAEAGERTGILQTSAGAYEFTPSNCLVYDEGGVYDIEIQGPGTAPDGEKLFFSFSSTGNEMTVQLGVDEPFRSSDREFRAGQYVSEPFTVDVSDGAISVSGIVLVDQQRQTVDADASLRIDCGP